MEHISPDLLNELNLEDGDETEETATVSLFEVMTSRNRFVQENELWALCRECCLTLEYVHDCHDLFQSLCISPDTVAFDSEGNVCFLDLDMEPESMYLAPEHAQYGQKSHKSHLFSLGMTLLFAAKCNTGYSDPDVALSDTVKSLLMNLTCKENERRPDMDTVIEACDRALAEESSQDICKMFIGLQSSASSECRGIKEDNKNNDCNKKGTVSTQHITNTIQKDYNDNCLLKKFSNQNVNSRADCKENRCSGAVTLQDISFDKDVNTVENQRDVAASQFKKKGILLADLLNSLDRSLDEPELWSVCRECVLSLHRKMNHLPAYISPDTIIITDSGTISYKAIPEDKLLEVMYMAPELQQKGILNEKTCLYGLGFALRNTAGFKNSSFLSASDGEALDILITSFTHGNSDKRPDLDTAFEMCEEYEKVSKTNSQQVCLQLYEETVNKSGSSTVSDSETLIQVSSENINCCVTKHAAEVHDNTYEASSDKELETVSTQFIQSQSAFRSFDTTLVEENRSYSSAFQNVALKPKPIKDVNRVPSAFISPATHFKPIVLQHLDKESTMSEQQDSGKSGKTYHTVTKNTEHGFLDSEIPESTNDFIELGKTSGKECENRKFISDRKELTDSANLGQALHQLQSQGHLPNTDVLASALAHYLSSYLTDSASKQGHITAAHTLKYSEPNSTTGMDNSAIDISTHSSAAVSQFSAHPLQPPQMNYSTQQNINHSFHNTRASEIVSTQQIPQSFSGNISTSARVNNSGSNFQNPSTLHVSGAALTQLSGTLPFPLSTPSVANYGSYQSAAVSGLPPTNLPVQYTLVQDLTTGIMQMLPVPYVPMSHTQTSQGISALHNMDANIRELQLQHSSSGAKLYNADPRSIDWSFRSSQQHNHYSSVSDKPSLEHQIYQSNHWSERDHQVREAEQYSNGYPQPPDYRARINHQQKGDDKNLLSWSTSPSKDASISLSQQPTNMPHSMEILVNKQNSSLITDRHVFSNVLHIIRETFVEDGYLNSGADDHVIAEYILSLSSLTWDTFCNAITEKYFHLVWSFDVLSTLFKTIGGHNKPPNLKHAVELLPPKLKRPQQKCNVRDSRKYRESEPNNEHFDREEINNFSSHKLSKQQLISQQQLNRQFHDYDRQEGQQLFNEFGQERYKRHQMSNHHKVDSHERQQLSSQHKLDKQERQQLSSQINSTQEPKFHSGKPQLLLSDFRPRSEIRKHKHFYNQTSDSTDSRTRHRKQHVKKHNDLDNTKRSLSLHNINFSCLSSSKCEQESKDENLGCTHSAKSLCQNSDQMLLKDDTMPNNSTIINKPGYLHIGYTSVKAASPFSDKASVNSCKSSQGIPVTYSDSVCPTSKFADINSGYSSPPVSMVSDSSSKSDASKEHRQENLSTFTETKVPSKQVSQYSQENNNSGQVTVSVLPLPSPYSHSIPYLPSHLQVSREYTDSKHLMLQQNISGSSQKQFTANGHSNQSKINRDISGNELDVTENQRLPSTTFISKAVRPSVNSTVLDCSRLPSHKQHVSPTSASLTNNGNQNIGDSISDSSLSEEMRKLAAEKPELYSDRCSSGLSMSHEKSKHIINPQNHRCGDSQKSQTLQTATSGYKDKQGNNIHTQKNQHDLAVLRQRPNVSIASPPETKTGLSSLNNSVTPLEYELSLSDSRTQSQNTDSGTHNQNNNRTNNYNGRSFSAVYSRHSDQPKTGVFVQEPAGINSISDIYNRRGSDGSSQLPEINSILLPYAKKDKVVYHSAMIQLSLTAEVNAFINSIDEEHKTAIEKCLASISQEIAVHRRQRQKTRRLFKKLSDQNVASGKGDQNVSEQMLKDMADMTRKLSFLHLCQTHLQMLLAELHGLDSSFLCSLSITEGTSALNLQPVTKNPYLQFRTLSTPEAEQMIVLQAGTPRGLMSYLYTSSALSNGYIHQFLLCFRYILTADQLLTFILEKYHSAQRSNQKDVNMVCIQRRSIDLLHFWIEGYYSVDFASNLGLIKKFADFVKEQTNANGESTDSLYSLYAACRLGENIELMHVTETDEGNSEEGAYFSYLNNPKRWDSFRSLLKRSKSDKSKQGSGFSSRKSKSDFKEPSTGHRKPTSQFSIVECMAHTLAEQLTLREQALFKKCHPVHFLNSQFQGVGVALTMPGNRTPSMSRKVEANQGPKRSLFVGEPAIDSYVVQMINHAQELAHWVSAEILSCGSNKTQANVITKFLTAAHLCQEVQNYATAISILDGLENLVVRQLPVWKNIPAKALVCMEELTNVKMKLKSEALWLMSEKDCHMYPTIPCALFVALHIQQVEIGSYTLASGMYKWDKMRSISEVVDQLRIFREHEYGFQPDYEIQRSLHRCLSEYSEKDLHVVASTQDNNFRRHPSSSSLSGTLKKVKDMLKKKT